MYSKGISREGSLLDVGVDLDIIDKSGAWFTYEGEHLGQGRTRPRRFWASTRDHGGDHRAGVEGGEPSGRGGSGANRGRRGPNRLGGPQTGQKARKPVSGPLEADR